MLEGRVLITFTFIFLEFSIESIIGQYKFVSLNTTSEYQKFMIALCLQIFLHESCLS